jgi:hypothetical protein
MAFQLALSGLYPLSVFHMSILKYIHRLQHIDHLIRRCATGKPDTFASKVGLCRSALMDYLRELREIGAPIGYCKRRESYFYQEDKQLFIGYTAHQLPRAGEQQVTGGRAPQVGRPQCNWAAGLSQPLAWAA